MASPLYHQVHEDNEPNHTPSRVSAISSESENSLNISVSQPWTENDDAFNADMSNFRRRNEGSPRSTSFTDMSLNKSSRMASLRPANDRRSRLWTTAIFSLTTVLLFADQNLMSPNLTSIARDFGFNDEERDRKLGGDIAFAFFLVGAPAAFVVGCLGDSFNRTRLFAWTVGIGEGACLLTFFCTSYKQLYISRAVTGFSIGGALPLIYSILGDLFIAEQRHSVSALVGIGTGIGIAVGQGVSGFLGPVFGWRFPFLLVSIPALICAVLVLFTVEDPERGGKEAAVLEFHQERNREMNQHQYEASTRTEDRYGVDNLNDEADLSSHDVSTSVEMVPLGKDTDTNSKIMRGIDQGHVIGKNDENHTYFDFRQHWFSFVALLSTKSILLLLLQGAVGTVPWGIVNTYLNDFLSEDRGMSVQYATTTVLVFGVGNFFGMLLGGGGGSYLYHVDSRYPAILAGSMAILGCFPFWVMLNFVDSTSSILFLATVSVVSGFGSGVTGPIVKATLQNVTHPCSRGQAFALFNTFDDLGKGIGPIFVAGLIGRMGRTSAFNVGVWGWILCGFFNLVIYFTVRSDEATVQATISAHLTRQNNGAIQSQYDDNERLS